MPLKTSGKASASNWLLSSKDLIILVYAKLNNMQTDIKQQSCCVKIQPMRDRIVIPEPVPELLTRVTHINIHWAQINRKARGGDELS